MHKINCKIESNNISNNRITVWLFLQNMHYKFNTIIPAAKHALQVEYALQREVFGG